MTQANSDINNQHPAKFERLRMLSFNIQVGIDCHKYSDYIRNSWRHFLPHAGRHENLTRIAELLSHYDVVALQEVDSGSLRSSYVNQVKFLAEHAGFPHWHLQRNRNLAHIAAHSNGLLTKIPAEMAVDHMLPGIIPGRGALQVSFGSGKHTFTVLVVHLALGKKARCRQLSYIAHSLEGHKYFAIMGDMNCEPEQVSEEFAKYGLEIKPAQTNLPTYPSWDPKRSFDQIVASSSLEIENVAVVPEMISDHLPISMDIILPGELVAQICQRDSISTTLAATNNYVG